MKVKTSELSGKALDWATGKSMGNHVGIDMDGRVKFITSYSPLEIILWQPSTDWNQCGNLIEAEGIEFKWVSDATLEAHSYLHDPHYGYGLTHQEAACRLMVVSKLGDEVDIPDELMEVGE